MDYEVLTIERHDQTATLWLDSPERRNAMGPAFWKELPLAMRELGDDPEVRAIMIAGKGRDFTIGLDLKAMMGAVAPEKGGSGGRFRQLDEIVRLQASISAVADCPKPVIAAIHGYCLGGGIDLVTACDIRYAAKGAIFSIRETRIAIVFAIMALLRMTRPLLTNLPWLSALDDSGIAMAGAISLFLIPSGSKEDPLLLRWAYAERLPWGVLILFGGGLSLASAGSNPANNLATR